MTTVYKWRIFCIAEGIWVYSWGVDPPLACINNTAHEVNSSSVQVIEKINNAFVDIQNNYSDSLQSSRIVQQTPIIDIKSFHGVSTHRNIVSTSGTGTVSAISETDSEIKLSISGSGDVVNLASARRGYYVTGFSSECGIAIRIPTTLTGTQSLKFGYFDENNGYYFKVGNANDLQVGIMYNGTETLFSRNSFNRNSLDGNESNGITLDLTKGVIFRIDFTWYGYGSVTFSVIQTDNKGEQKAFPMHVYNTETHTSCANPSLPINVILSSNGETAIRDIFIGGRQYSIVGDSTIMKRSSMMYKSNVIAITSVLSPLFSIKKKANYKSCGVEITRIRAKCNVDCILQLYVNPTLTGSSFLNNANVNESCVDVDESSTAISGGSVYKTYLIFGGNSIERELKDIYLIEDQTISFAWKTISGSGTVSIDVEWSEAW